MKLRRAPYLDALTIDAETVVLLPGRATLLSPLGSTLWQLLDDDTLRDLAELAPQLIVQHGPPPHPAALADLARELGQGGVVICEAELAP